MVPTKGEVTSSGSVAVTVDAAKRRPLRHIWSFVGYDEPNYTYTEHGRELLWKLAELNDAPYAIRCHFLLCSGDGTPRLKFGSSNVYTEDATGTPVYSWPIIDRIFDTYVQLGCVPFVELGFMPEALTTAPHGTRYDNPKGGGGWGFPPKDYARWQELISEVARHVLARYGLGEVCRWYWELWNEPDISYWNGTLAEYCTLYDHTEAGLHSVLPQACLGGPGTTNPSRDKASEFLRGFLEHCARGTNAVSGKHGARLDFISFHSKGGSFKADPADPKHTPTVDNLLHHIECGLAIAAELPELAGLGVHITECDPDGWAAGTVKDNPNLHYRNSEYYASYLAMSACRILPLANRWPNPVHSMLTWAFEFEGQGYFEGFRTLSTNGLDKPVLNSLRLLSRLGRVALHAECADERIGCIASADDGGRFSLFLCSHHDDWDERGSTTVRVTLAGVPTAWRYEVRSSTVDHDSANSHTAWRAEGSPQTPSREQLERIREASRLVTEEATSIIAARRTDPAAGAVTVEVELQNHAACLVTLTPLPAANE